MHLLRRAPRGQWLVGPVVLSTLLACDGPAAKLSADEAKPGATAAKAVPASASEAVMREQLAPAPSAKAGGEPARIRATAATDKAPASGRSASRPMPPVSLPPAAAKPRAMALADDPLDGLLGPRSYEDRPAAAAGKKERKASAAAMAAPAAANATFAERAPPAPPPVVRLDPNARYATTYRPGGGALAELDAGLARGTIPAVYRDLVGDFGARYAAPLAAPAAGAMAVAADTERAVLPPSGGPLHLRVALRSAAAPHLARARLSVTLALDVSGSMQGQAIENARAAAAALVRRLDGNDRFSLVTFSNGARLVVRAGPIGPRRRAVLARIAGIQTEGGTNVGAGLSVAYDEARRAQGGDGADTVRIVMLLSDGQANEGITDRASLAALSANAFQDGIQTSAFGLGDSFDAPLLGAIADRGAGGYYYLADAAQIAPAFARELDARLVPVALAVEVRVRLRPEVAATKVYGSRVLDDREAADVRAQEVSADAQAARRHGIKRDRQHDAPGGMRFFMPSFARDDRHALLLALQVPPGVGDRPIGSVELRYKDRLLGRNVTREIPVRVRYGRSDAQSARTIDPGVLRTVQAFAAGDAILAAAGRVDSGDREAASRLLAERAELLARAARDLAEPRFKEDGLRLARLASAVGGVSDPLALAVLLRGSGTGYLQ